MSTNHPQCTSTILMVAPTDFAFNEQTAIDNEFQHKPALSQEELRKKAIEEYRQFVSTLRQHQVYVISIDEPCTVTVDKKHISTPDAVYPNNWLSTDSNGRVFLFPMKSANRNAERLRISQVLEEFKKHQLEVSEVIDVKKENTEVLEGTGSMVMDHKNKMIYAALSERTSEQALKYFAQKTNYNYIAFNTKSLSGREYYHTNIIMSIGEDFAVVCSECIVGENKVVEQLKKHKKDVITITREQTEKYFCGNILQVENAKGEKLIVMSENAYKGFTKEQLQILEKHGKIIRVDISTIEYVGGGSCRCMMAEVFLKKKK